MSVPLRQEKKSEAALVVFTVLVPTSAGMAAFSLLASIFALTGIPCVGVGPFLAGGLLAVIFAVTLAATGMLGSVAHLAKPFRAPSSLRNIRSSWLSREIATVSLFFGFLLIWLLGEAVQLGWLSLAGCALSTIIGVALLAVIAQAYKISTRPAWCGNECFVELLACFLGAGSAAAIMCLSQSAWGEVASALWVAGIVASVASLALDVCSHKSRMHRLEAMREESDERIPLTLEQYGKLKGKVRLAWALGATALILTVVGLWPAAYAAQLSAHTIHRTVFYKLPVQVRYVARLRK